jgi:hypothetical protein
MRLVERNVEELLRPESRAQLPLHRLLVLYFDPFSLFKDASRGPESARRRARAYNRALRGILLAYLRRWLFIAASLFAAVTPSEALAAEAPIFKLSAAACAVGSCIALAVIACTAVAYLILGTRD